MWENPTDEGKLEELSHDIDKEQDLVLSEHVCIGKDDVGRRVCRRFGPIGFTITKFYSDSSQY